MRKVTAEITRAFMRGESKIVGNSRTDGKRLYLHGNCIAKWQDGKLWVTDAGWQTNATKERLNGLPGVSIYQKNFRWYLNDVEWDGSWVEVTR